MKLMEHMELSESGKLYCALLFMAYIKMFIIFILSNSGCVSSKRKKGSPVLLTRFVLTENSEQCTTGSVNDASRKPSAVCFCFAVLLVALET